MLSRPEDTPPLAAVTENAWDCHVHVFGPPARYPLAGARRYTPSEASAADAAEHGRRLGARHLVLVQASPYGDDNGCLLDALATLGGDSRGVVSLDPSALDDATLAELDTRGVRGVRLNPNGRVGAVASIAVRLVDLAERLEGTRWHIAVNSAAELAPEILALARSGSKDVAVVFDHLMGLDPSAGQFTAVVESAVRIAADDERVWVKVSGLERVSPTPMARQLLEQAVSRLLETAPDRLVWGSDWPHTPLLNGATGFRVIDEESELRAVLRVLGPTAERVLQHNPALLFR